MLIRSLSLENWKCFSESMTLDFNTIEIFSFPNGSGKTSVLEAVYYALFGKVEGSLSTYQNHEGKTSVSIMFDMDGIEYKIDRSFPDSTAKLYKDGVLDCSGVREVYAYIDSIYPYSLVKRLWFKGDIAESEVLSFRFFKEEVLAEQLKTPMALHKYYSQQSREALRQSRQIQIPETRPVAEIDKEISSVRSRLRDRDSANDAQYRRALRCRDANAELDTLKKTLGTPLDQTTIRRWRAIDLDRTRDDLAQEQTRGTDEDLSSLSHSALESVSRANSAAHHCVVCGGEWSHDRESYVTSLLERGFRSEERVKSLKEIIEFKESIDASKIEQSERYYSLASEASAVPNYESVIESYSRDNDALWNKMDALTSERDTAVRASGLQEQKAALVKSSDESKKRAAFIRQYIDSSVEYYTAALLQRANDTLEYINQDYSGLSISDGSLLVSVSGRPLAVSQLSRGERTMVAMSLVYAIRDIFTPSMPLIFDESFASLSSENNNRVIDIIARSQEQVFVVTHSIDWVDSDSYDDSITTIRTRW